MKGLTEEQLEAIREFIHFVCETGQLSFGDNDFIKAMYYDFRNTKSLNQEAK